MQSEVTANEWFETRVENRPDSFSYKDESFKVRKELGEGGQGQSILVEGRLGLDKVENLYVFKFLDVSWQDRAEKEAERFKPIKKLRPDIARVAQLREVMKESGRAIGLIYDYVEGRTLDKLGIELRSSPQHMSGVDLQKMCISILCTLRSLHHVNVIHRDVKPDNLMLLDNRTGIRMIDFGTARDIGPSGPDGQHFELRNSK